MTGITGNTASAVAFQAISRGVSSDAVRTNVTADYTVVAADYIVAYTTLSASRVVTVPGSQRAGRIIVIKDETGTCSPSTTITVSGTIDGQSSVVLNSAYAVLRLYSNGTSWSRIS